MSGPDIGTFLAMHLLSQLRAADSTSANFILAIFLVLSSGLTLTAFEDVLFRLQDVGNSRLLDLKLVSNGSLRHLKPKHYSGTGKL